MKMATQLKNSRQIVQCSTSLHILYRKTQSQHNARKLDSPCSYQPLSGGACPLPKTNNRGRRCLQLDSWVLGSHPSLSHSPSLKKWLAYPWWAMVSWISRSTPIQTMLITSPTWDGGGLGEGASEFSSLTILEGYRRGNDRSVVLVVWGTKCLVLTMIVFIGYLFGGNYGAWVQIYSLGLCK